MRERVVRAAASPDAPALSLVGAATFLETFAGVLNGEDVTTFCAERHSVAWYQKALSAGDAWLATVDEAPIGYALTGPPDLPVAAKDGDIELKRIYVLSRWHGTGIGRTLLDRVVRHASRTRAPRLLLGVYAGNARARAFYRREGFEEVGERRFVVGTRAYDDVVHALRLTDGVRPLDQPHP